jgi:hypothetical protein
MMTAWQRFLHTVTAWNTYRQPPAERVDVPKAQAKVIESVPYDWPGPFVSLEIRGSRYDRANPSGVGSGTPMQNGLAATRPLTWGWAKWNQQYRADIPRPAAGWYWTTGYPSPTYDRHCIVAAPDGTVHEMIQFDPFAGPGGPPLPNQALGWSMWRDGEMVGGKPTTATGHPCYPYIWTSWSHLDPHEQRLVLHDYVGADGALTVGPIADTRWVLDRNSVSYAAMIALGGDCAARTEALATFGCRLIDRAGYVDANVESKRVGTQPLPPSLTAQPGRQWGLTNAHLFRVALADLRLVTA